ncbi:MAG: DUF6526 family protein [Cytophaga sp.]|uniref:DUF6526 family protein n=1 Tax=Cytophaga sp. TaxID=29535 RepID=UPI003F7FD15D
MKTQKYSNHKRYYTPHHFIFYPVVLTCAGVASFFIFSKPDDALIWLAFTGLFLMLASLSFLKRHH